MCGIAGVIDLHPGRPGPYGTGLEKETITSRMLSSIRHRGPDQFGIYTDDTAAIGSARLSMLDLPGGRQPIPNEDESLWIVFNGEVFNYRDLREDLLKRGHRFTTGTDTEVILHLFEDRGPECLSMLNGQFAIAIWDRTKRTLFLARDRLGVRPLFYTASRGAFVFASEVKAILNAAGTRDIDPQAMNEVFTFWAARSPRTAFRDIAEVPPAHYLLLEDGETTAARYWSLRFPSAEASRKDTRTEGEMLEQLGGLLADATRLRLHADVPVGLYLSGGLDSAVVGALAQRWVGRPIDAFSVAFRDPAFDEREFQGALAREWGCQHRTVEALHSDIGEVFPDVVWHAETPLLRSAPGPMFLLARLVRSSGLKIVLSGEGSDEFLGGYGIFKEAAVRRFMARQPGSSMRSLLVQRLYPEIKGLASPGVGLLSSFFQAAESNVPYESHAVRWRTTARGKRFFSRALRDAIGSTDGCLSSIELPAEFDSWGPLERAQYLEATLFLPQYLLSSQGDRMAMANSVEARYPFLDYRVVEFANTLPSNLKLRVLSEKYLLRKLAARLLPPVMAKRRKHPYRAPIHNSFFHSKAPAYIQEMLAPGRIASAGLFDPKPVAQMVEKIQRTGALGETDDMALSGILSAQLLHHLFVANFKRAEPLGGSDDVKFFRCWSVSEGQRHSVPFERGTSISPQQVSRA